jgi:hypothetical protein
MDPHDLIRLEALRSVASATKTPDFDGKGPAIIVASEKISNSRSVWLGLSLLTLEGDDAC